MKRSSSYDTKKEDEKREASDVESELSSSSDPEDTSNHQKPPTLVRSRMKLMPIPYSHRYKSYVPEPEDESVSGSSAESGLGNSSVSGLGNASVGGPSAYQVRPGADRRILGSPELGVDHGNVRKIEKVRNKRRLRRAPKKITKKAKRKYIVEVDVDVSSYDSDSSSSDPQQEHQPSNVPKA